MDFERYQRQIIVKELGKKSQEILSNKNVVIIGGGGLGSNSADILTRLGIGSLYIYDEDKIDLSNIHRTSIFNEEDVGKFKAQVLSEKLKKINSEVNITGHIEKVTKKNISKIVQKADIIIDGTDNMQTRFIINEISIKNKKPWVYAGVYSTVAMIMGIIPKKTPCLRCISQNIIEKKEIIPVLGNLPLTTASIQCTETLKILLNKKPTGLIIYDIWKQQFEKINIKRNPNCKCCCKEKYEYL